jgi:hypothetical protein
MAQPALLALLEALPSVRPAVVPVGRHSAPPQSPGLPRLPGIGRLRHYPLRGRHVREHRLVRVGGALAAPDVALTDDLLVLQVLRQRPLVDLDAAQVAAFSALPPSVVAPALDRLVRSGLARDTLVGGRVRFGLP